MLHVYRLEKRDGAPLVSSPERGLLELLSEVGVRQPLREARELQQGLDDNERRFLLSLVTGIPEWRLLEIPHLEQLPALRWKLHNLEQLKNTNAKKFAEQAKMLADKLVQVGPNHV